MDIKRLGKKVLEARLAADLSQEDLARRADMASSYVSKLERGLITRPGAQSLTAIAGALGMSLAELTGDQVGPSESRALGEWTELVTPDRGRAISPDWTLSDAISRAGSPSYPVPIPVVAVANAGRGGGYVEEWAFVPYEEAHGRTLRAYRASGVCMEPHVHDGDTVIVDCDASPQDGEIVAAVNLDTGDFLIKWYAGRNGRVELRPEQGEPILLRADRVKIEGVVIQVNRKAPRKRRA